MSGTLSQNFFLWLQLDIAYTASYILLSKSQLHSLHILQDTRECNLLVSPGAENIIQIYYTYTSMKYIFYII